MSRALGVAGQGDEAVKSAAVPPTFGCRPRSGNLRVLMTLDAVGGVWRYAVDLASALRPLCVEVVFAGLGPRPSPQQISEAQAVGELVWLDEPLEWTVVEESALAVCGARIARLAEAYCADVIHLNAPSQAAELDTPLPIVVVSHSCVVTWWRIMREGPLPASWRWQRRRNCAGFLRADAVVAPSRSHASLTRQCYGPLPAFDVVYNAAEPQPLACEPKEAFVLAAARWWDEGKNGRVLDRAATRIGLPVCMAGAVAGPGGQSFTIGNAQYLGELSREEMRAHLTRAEIVVSPSLYEPFGLLALEAANAGCALVLSDIPTYRELWSGAAVFFDPRDEKALARVVNALACDPERRNAFAKRAKARARRFSLAGQASSMAQIYARVIGVDALGAKTRGA